MALYNTELKRIRTAVDCISCPHYDTKLKACKGLGTVCLEIDTATNTILDSVTGLPINIEKEKNNGNI